MNISATQPNVKASSLPIEQLASNPNVSDRDKVTEACKQFEAILLRQILEATRKTVIASSANPESTSSGIYNDMINNQLASKISQSGAFGLAKSLQAQLVRQVLPSGSAAIARGTPEISQLHQPTTH